VKDHDDKNNSYKEMQTRIVEYMKQEIQLGHKVGIIKTQSNWSIPEGLSVIVFPLGVDANTDIEKAALVARGLFAALRQLDEKDKVNTVLVEGISEAHTGLAVMNRLRKAASITI